MESYQSAFQVWILLLVMLIMGLNRQNSGENLNYISPYVDFQCVESATLWRNNKSAIDEELYAGFYKSDVYSERQINEISGAYDWRDTSPSNFAVSVLYNYTFANDTGGDGPPPNVIRFARALNLVSSS